MPTFATPEPITATLTTAGARVRITAAERPDTVVRVEPLNSADRSDVKVAENTTVEFAAGELSVRTTKAGDRNGSVAVTVELPAGSRLVLSTAWTDVDADGPLGDCDLTLASGQVRLDRVAALRAQLASGEVTIGHVAGTAEIQSSAGGVRIGEVAGVLRYHGATGPVWIGHALSDVDLTSASGGFAIDRADGSVTAKGANCPIRIGRLTRGQAELANHSDGIEIGISEGTAAWVDARSTKGSVRNSLPGQDDPAAFENQVRIHARARHDDIVIRRAAS